MIKQDFPKVVWAFVAALAALCFAASPFLSDGFNGFSPDQFPVPQDNPPVQPAGYAFSIWGLIYLWLIAGTAFGLIRRATDEDWAPARPWLSASLIVGVAWIPAANLSVPAATIMIWVMLATGLIALFKLGDEDRWLQLSPVAIYTGWLTAASCVSIGLVLAGYGILNGTVAAFVSIILALGIALFVQFSLHRAPEYGLTVIWALVGIILSNTQPVNIAVIGLCIVGIIAILAVRGTDTE